MHRDHGQVGARTYLDLESPGVALQPGCIFLARARIHDDPEPCIGHVVDDKVVNHAAGFIEHATVERFAGVFELGNVVRKQIAEVVARACPDDIGDQHVRNVEHPGVATHSVVLVDLRAVVDGHIPAAEVDHARTGGHVRVVQRCS